MKKNNRKMDVSRRDFLGAAAATAVFTIVPRYVLGGPKFVAPAEKGNVAIIGAGGQGRTNARALFAEDAAQVMAVCDVAEVTDLEPFYYKGKGGRKTVIAEAEKHYQEKNKDFKCAEYEDFREMLDKEKAIDAILCATPDHNHALVSITAMKQGKHVYCEKPLTHNVWEAREVAKVARDTGLATQLGNQGHSTVGIRETVEHLRAGTIGTVREIHAWVETKRWNPALTTKPADTPPPPAGMNWDLWL